MIVEIKNNSGITGQFTGVLYYMIEQRPEPEKSVMTVAFSFPEVSNISFAIDSPDVVFTRGN